VCRLSFSRGGPPVKWTATIPFSLVDPAGQETAVHGDGGAGDEPGGIGG
jgi:hypothetical protein